MKRPSAAILRAIVEKDQSKSLMLDDGFGFINCRVRALMISNLSNGEIACCVTALLAQ
jgi:hypothetical protein